MKYAKVCKLEIKSENLWKHTLALLLKFGFSCDVEATHDFFKLYDRQISWKTLLYVTWIMMVQIRSQQVTIQLNGIKYVTLDLFRSLFVQQNTIESPT